MIASVRVLEVLELEVGVPGALVALVGMSSIVGSNRVRDSYCTEQGENIHKGL
jgi:hypothetical protein